MHFIGFILSLFALSVLLHHNNKQIEIMKATKIIIEIELNEKLQFIQYKNLTVWEALKKIKKEFGEVLIYDVKTQY